ncbi:MAG: hypothetical protein ACP5PA_00440 [Elusimicrobiales bacterium]
MLLSPEIELAEIPGRSVVVRYDDIFLVLIFISWLVRSSISKERSFILKTPLNLPILVYTSIYILSTFLGVIRGDVQWKKAFFYVLKYSEYFMLYFMTVNVLYEEKDIKRIARYGVVVLITVVIYSFYYYHNASGIDIRTTAPFEASVGKPSESEPASLGGYYMIWSFILLGFIAEINSIKKILFTLIILAGMYLSLLLSFSRASYLAAVAGWVVFLIFVDKKRIFFMWLSIFLVVFSMTMPGISEKVKDRIRYTYEGDYATNRVETPFGDIYLEDSAYARYRNLKNVITNVLPSYPLLGKGVTGIGLGDSQYVLLLGEGGILGFLSFFWLIFSVLFVARKVYIISSDPFERAIGIGIFCATIALLVQGWGVNSFIIVRIMEPYWFSVAVLNVAYLKNLEKAQTR